MPHFPWATKSTVMNRARVPPTADKRSRATSVLASEDNASKHIAALAVRSRSSDTTAPRSFRQEVSIKARGTSGLIGDRNPHTASLCLGIFSPSLQLNFSMSILTISTMTENLREIFLLEDGHSYPRIY